MAKLALVGAGMMGSALCVPLSDVGHELRLIGTPLDELIVRALEAGQAHPKLGLTLPSGVRAYPVARLASACEGADAILLGVSSAGIDWAATTLGPILEREPRPVLLVSKGLELSPAGLRVLTQAFAERLPHQIRDRIQPVSVCGPCIAGELARRVPTLVVLTGRDADVVGRFTRWLATSYYHPVPSADVVGVQVCAALKNAYAMGVALGAGLHRRAHGERGSVAMHNYEAAVFAQACLEMQRLVLALGGDACTALGLAGAGDLQVTCNGGRTGRFGELLGFGHRTQEAVELMQGATLECLEVLGVLEQFLGRSAASVSHADLPLLTHLIAVALHGAALDMPFGEFARA
jgi:glycerol-3-phosphate dehydrogenase (NAD(P)+)